MDTQQILEALEFNTGTFPREAVQEAINRRDELVPELLRMIEDAKQLPEILSDDCYMGLIFALYLLAYYRENRAYPLIVEFFSIPGDITLEYTGNVVTEDLHRILASVAHGDSSLMKQLVENEEVNEYVRGAALRAMVTQVACGEASREEVVAYFRSLFRTLTREPGPIWTNLVSCINELFPEEAMEDINQAYEEGLVTSIFVDSSSVIETLEQGKESALQMLQEYGRHEFIHDVVADISWWHCFKRPGPPTSHKPKSVLSAKQMSGIFARPNTKSQVDNSGTTPTKKVGRNAPCPCGSGKKFKKCCGGGAFSWP